MIFLKSRNLQHQNLLRDKLRARVVIRPTTPFNLHRNNVARQVVRKCCLYYLTFKLRTGNYDESCRITGKTSLFHRFMKIAETHWAASSIMVLLRKIKPIRIYKIYGSNLTSSAQITAARRWEWRKAQVFYLGGKFFKKGKFITADSFSIFISSLSNWFSSSKSFDDWK